jgi:HSP20 family protein
MLMRPWTAVHSGWNRLEAEPQGAGYWPGLAASYPPVNVWDDDNHVYVEAELPGVPKDRLELFVHNGNELTLRGERSAPETSQGMWHRQERGLGRFSRIITLPAAVSADGVKAQLEQGVLTVTLAKAEEARPRRIPVQAG